MSRPNPKHRQALALAGGGYMGLFTAEVLAILEHHGVDWFATTDLFAGTSIGSIIALGLAAEVPAAKIRDAMVEHGPTIFPQSVFPILDTARQAVTSKHDAKKLRDVIESLVGGKKLGELKRSVIVPSVDLTAASYRLFTGGPNSVDAEVTIADAAIASAAAPTYFPAHAIGGELYADGGLIANAPDVLAAISGIADLGWTSPHVRLLSFGTTQFSPALPGAEKSQKFGAKDWATDLRLLKLSMAAQVQLSRHLATKLLGEENILIVDPVLSANQNEVVGLDKATADSTVTLLAVAKKTGRDLNQKNASKTFIALWKNHKAQDPT